MVHRLQAPAARGDVGVVASGYAWACAGARRVQYRSTEPRWRRGWFRIRLPLPRSIPCPAYRTPSRRREASLAAGRMQYQINCAVCHGDNADGQGNATRYGFPAISLQNETAKGTHRWLHLRHDPEWARTDAVVQPHRGARPLGRHQLRARAAGSRDRRSVRARPARAPRRHRRNGAGTEHARSQSRHTRIDPTSADGASRPGGDR